MRGEGLRYKPCPGVRGCPCGVSGAAEAASRAAARWVCACQAAIGPTSSKAWWAVWGPVRQLRTQG